MNFKYLLSQNGTALLSLVSIANLKTCWYYRTLVQHEKEMLPLFRAVLKNFLEIKSTGDENKIMGVKDVCILYE